MRLAVIGGIAAALLSACATTPATDNSRGETSTSGAASFPAIRSQATTQPSVSAAPIGNSIPVSPVKQREPKLDPDHAVYFSRASFDLPEDALVTLRKYADQLNGDRHLVVTLIGSTDDLGSKEMCVAIATRRAAAVEDQLISLGVRARQIRKYARGCDAAIDPSCTSDNCRKQYRRVELRINNF